jgi:hypothetical protein
MSGRAGEIVVAETIRDDRPEALRVLHFTANIPAILGWFLVVLCVSVLILSAITSAALIRGLRRLIRMT